MDHIEEDKLNKEKYMEKENLSPITISLVIKDNGRMINLMDMEHKSTVMELDIKDILLME